MKVKSLQFKLSALFIILLLTISGIGIYTVTRSSDMYLAEANQKAQLDLACSIASEKGFKQSPGNITPETMTEIFKAAMVINPSIYLYLVDLEGNVTNASAKPGEIKQKHVNVSKIQNLINNEHPLPVFGADPRDPEENKIFSACLLTNEDGSPHGFLYIILGKEKIAATAPNIQQSYILQVLFRTLIIGIGSVLIIGLLLILLLTSNLKKLANAVQRIHEGDFSARVKINSGDELSDLANAFNGMALKIENSLNKLKENDALRRELVANISHDLRTPLASIEGYTETILYKNNLLSENEKKTYYETILNNTKSLKRLVSELLELSKLEAKQTVPHPEPFSITDLAQDVKLKLQPQASKKNITINSTFDQGIPFVNADIGLIERVLQNLIENAIRYSPENGEVIVGIHREDDSYVKVYITDSGKGINPEDLENVFNRYQSDNIRKKSSNSLGIGLTIAKKIMELHQSDLRVESFRNEGTTFSFLLRVA